METATTNTERLKADFERLRDAERRMHQRLVNMPGLQAEAGHEARRLHDVAQRNWQVQQSGEAPSLDAFYSDVFALQEEEASLSLEHEQAYIEKNEAAERMHRALAAEARDEVHRFEDSLSSVRGQIERLQAEEQKLVDDRSGYASQVSQHNRAAGEAGHAARLQAQIRRGRNGRR